VRVRDQVPVSYLLVFGFGNIVLQGLNWFWFVHCFWELLLFLIDGGRFYKMIESLRRRFSADAKERNKLVVEMPGDVIDHGYASNQRVNDYGTNSK
jgi:hypothetical protein